jgi:AraC-like DNA-binding protein
VHSERRPAHLRGLVEFMWLFDGSMTCLRERTFPNGLLEIIVHLGERYRVVDKGGTWVCPTTCLTGLQLGHLVVEAPSHRTRVLGIRLTPAGAYALFARPMHEVTRLTVDLEDLAGAAASELAERCHAATTVEHCFQHAVQWIDARLARAVRIDPAVAWTVAEIRRHAGAVSIAALRERTGWSRTRLSETFRAQVGVSAKQYARVIRFRHVLDRIHAGDPSLSPLDETRGERELGKGSKVGLADAAHEAGYYDQPHMNAEFKELSGFTPSEFLAAWRYPNTVSVAEA